MKKLALAVVLYIAMNSVYGAVEPENNWLYTVTNGRIQGKVTRFKFYAQDVISGQNATTTTVAEGTETNQSSTQFGLVGVVDDLLTETPDSKSKPVGRVQGLVVFSSKEETSTLQVVNYVFTGGKFNGSSLAVVGRNPLYHLLREIPIVGGTGMFRLARGFVTTKTYQIDSDSNNGVYEYNVFSIHY